MIKRVTYLPNRERIATEAAVWVAKLDGGPLTTDDFREMRAWAERSEHHRIALEEMAERWDNLDVLFLCREKTEVPVRSILRKQWLPAALAAGLAMLAVILVFSTDRALDGMTAQNATYSTAVGEQRDITLPDGTNLRINTNSRLRVAYSKERRNVRLYRGEVFFDVAESDVWPFEVDSGSAIIMAVGTAFAVRVGPNNSVEVNVSEGRVRVSTHANIPDAKEAGTGVNVSSTELQVSQRLRFNKVIESIQTLEPAQLERQLSWRDGMLIFDRDPLEWVVAEVSRYTSVRIIITDQALRGLEFGGYFPIGETDALLKTLEGDFGIRVDHVEPDLVYLRAAAP